MVGVDKQGGAPSHVNAKCLTPLAETDEILAPGLRAPCRGEHEKTGK